MKLLSRWVRPPAELRAQFSATERALAVAEGPDAVAVATTLALWLPADGGWRRIGWDEVVKATWSEDALHVIAGSLDQDGVVTDQPELVLPLTEPRNLPSVVRARVESSIARSEQVHVPGGPARIVGRRVPGRDGLNWTARLDTGTPDSPAARAVLIGYLDRMRASSTPEL